MKVSINILTWNNKSTIEKLMNTLKSEMIGIDHEYIFIDNGSDDGTLDIITNWIVVNLKDNFKIKRNPVNLGISKGKNRGIDVSDGEYIMMLDGDVVPVSNSIRLMIEWMDKNKKEVALGMYPNKFSPTEDHAEKYCEKLMGFKEHKCACLYYGIYRRKIFKKGLRMNEEGEFGKPGYGWEDHDFFQRFKKAGYIQHVAHINKESGKYYHHINSSIRAMGREKYMETSRARDKQFKGIWDATGQGAHKTPRRARHIRG